MTHITISSRKWVRESGRTFKTPVHSGRRFASWLEAERECFGTDYEPCWCDVGEEPDPDAWLGRPPHTPEDLGERRV